MEILQKLNVVTVLYVVEKVYMLNKMEVPMNVQMLQNMDELVMVRCHGMMDSPTWTWARPVMNHL